MFKYVEAGIYTLLGFCALFFGLWLLSGSLEFASLFTGFILMAGVFVTFICLAIYRFSR